MRLYIRCYYHPRRENKKKKPGPLGWCTQICFCYPFSVYRTIDVQLNFLRVFVVVFPRKQIDRIRFSSPSPGPGFRRILAARYPARMKRRLTNDRHKTIIERTTQNKPLTTTGVEKKRNFRPVPESVALPLSAATENESHSNGRRCKYYYDEIADNPQNNKPYRRTPVFRSDGNVLEKWI